MTEIIESMAIEMDGQHVSDDYQIEIHIPQDIYSLLVSLIEREELYKYTKSERIWFYTLASFSGFTQLCSLLFLYIEGINSNWYSEHEEYVTIDGKQSSMTILYGSAYFQEYNQKISNSQYIWQVLALFVLLSYELPVVKSFVDILVLLKHVKNLKIFIFYILLQFTLNIGTLILAGVLMLAQKDIIEVFSIGIGLIILLEVDDYIYSAVNTSVNSDIFVFKLNKNALKHTIYEKGRPLKWQMIYICAIYVPTIINQIVQKLIWNVGYEAIGEEHQVYFWSIVVMAIMLVPSILGVTLYFLSKSYKARMMK